jgi:hypothetical protein
MGRDARRKLSPFSAPNRTKEVRLDESRNIFIGYILYLDVLYLDVLYLDFLNPKHMFIFINFYDI